MDTFDLRIWKDFERAGGTTASPAIVQQISIDSRRISEPASLFVALKGERLDGHQFIKHAAEAGARYALIEQNREYTDLPSSITLLRVPNTLHALQDIVHAYRKTLPVKILAVTGSFGKTMIKDLLHAILSLEKCTAASPESFNSQIGVPLSLLTLNKSHEIAIIEAAISCKNEMDRLSSLIAPDYALITPIGKKHLSTLKDLPTLAHEIMKLAWATSPEGWTLMPHDKEFPHVTLPHPTYFWNEKSSQLPHAELVTPQFYQIVFPDRSSFQSKMTIGFSYFLNLINMAIKAAWLLGISADSIKKVLTTYQPEPMRTEIWRAPFGTTFINDTYCSDPQSVDQALRHFDQANPDHRKVFVFGGIRGQSPYQDHDYRHIGRSLHKAGVDHLVLFGNKPFEPLVQEVKNASNKTQITICQDYEEALSYLRLGLHPHDMVLLKGEKKASFEALTEAFNDSQNHNQCLINLAAIRSNLATLRKKLAPDTAIMVAVKALAYGTDDIRMAKFLETCGVKHLCVSYVDEGVALKRAGVKQVIFVINAAPYEAAKVVKWDLEVGVSDRQLIGSLENEARLQHKNTKVHLHINTGMGRFGCRPEEALELAQIIKKSRHLILEGIMTHFACAEDPQEDPFTRHQIELFDAAIEELKKHGIEAPWKHAANSSACVRFPLPQYNMVRIGLAVYGLYSSEAVKKEIDLHLALSLTSRIVGINHCQKGDTISYGRRYRVQKEQQKIGVLPIGYFDGLHRHYSEKAYVLVHGQKAPMVGNICMDYMMIDVTDIPEAIVGDKVLIFGEDEYGHYSSPEELASKGDSIIHELMTCLGPRIQRVFVYEEGKQIR